jgi:hypothetical protein
MTTASTTAKDARSAERISASQSLAQIVVIANGKPTTTSSHRREVRQAHRPTCCGNQQSRMLRRDLRSTQFCVESPTSTSKGKEQPCYDITRDGFSFLAWASPAKRPPSWKEKFIAAFNWQADEINRLHQMHASPDWQQARIEGKTARRDETDVIKAFVELRAVTGQQERRQVLPASRKKRIERLFFVKSAVGKDFRQGLSAQQLASVAMAERIVERSLLESMAAKTFYKDAYRTPPSASASSLR